MRATWLPRDRPRGPPRSPPGGHPAAAQLEEGNDTSHDEHQRTPGQDLLPWWLEATVVFGTAVLAMLAALLMGGGR